MSLRYIRNHSARHQFAEHVEVPVEIGENRQRPRCLGAQERTSPRQLEVRNGRGYRAVTDKLEDTQTSWTSQTKSNPYSNKKSVGPSWQVLGLEIEKCFFSLKGTFRTQLKSSTRELKNWSLIRTTSSSLLTSKTSLWLVITGTWRAWLHQSLNRRKGI